MEIIYDSLNIVRSRLIDSIVAVFESSEEIPILFFYSGGSAFSVLSELETRMEGRDLSHVIFAPVDERKDVRYSNACELAEKKLFSKSGAIFVDLGDLSRDLDEVADEYDKQVKVLIDDIHEHDGVIISLLGMGGDGHTAGIFPYPEKREFFEKEFVATERYVVGYDVGSKNQYKERITLTVPALMQANYTFVYVIGEEKRDALQKVMSNGEVAEIPARIWKQLPYVSVYTDINLE